MGDSEYTILKVNSTKLKMGSNIVSAVHNMRIAKEQFADFQREHPASKGAKLFGMYEGKLDWIVKDLITNPFLPEDVILGIKQEWESDVFAIPEINDKVSLLPPDKRELIETLIDAMLAGEEILFEQK